MPDQAIDPAAATGDDAGAGDPRLFFLPVAELCSRRLVSCAPGDRVDAVAATMREQGVSSVVVLDGVAAAGIVTDRDLRNKVVAAGRDPRSMTAAEVMSTPLVSVGERAPLHEALYRMSRERIHRVGVVDDAGVLVGLVTATDVLRLQARSALALVHEIEQAADVEALGAAHRRIERLVVRLVRTGVPTPELVRTVAQLNDRVLVRLIELVRARDFPQLTTRFAFLVLGSEARREQTLATDQDNAIVHADDLGGDELTELERFSHAVIDALIGIGVPECKGGIMARNAEWRRSLAQWKHTLGRWYGTPTPEHVLAGAMFFDLRTVYGDAGFERELKQHVAAVLHDNARFLVHAGANVVKFAPPLGLFGRLKTERKNGRRTMDIKKAGLFLITEGVKVLAQQAGHVDGGTRERIHALATGGVLRPAEAGDIEAAFDWLAELRLRAQVQAIEAGGKPVNELDVDRLDSIERMRLKVALETVAMLRTLLEQRLRLETVR